MALTRVKSGGWVVGERLTSTQANLLDTNAVSESVRLDDAIADITTLEGTVDDGLELAGQRRLFGNWVSADLHDAATSDVVAHYSSINKMFVVLMDSPGSSAAGYLSVDGNVWSNSAFSMAAWTGGVGSFSRNVAESGSGTLVVGGAPASSTDRKVHYSTNGGATWSLATAFGSSNTNRVLVGYVTPASKFVALEVGTTNVFSSTNGNTWVSATAANVTIPSIAALLECPAGLFLSSNTSLLKSVDGSTFSSVISAGSSVGVACYDSARDRVCALTSGGTLYVSTDNTGVSFTGQSVSVTGVTLSHLLGVYDGVFLFAGTHTGLSRSVVVAMVEADGTPAIVADTNGGALIRLAWGVEPRRVVGVSNQATGNVTSSPF